MVAPLIAGLIKGLFASGLTTLAGAVAAKGKEVIEEKLGVDLEAALETPEGLATLRQAELAHEEFLITSSMEDRRIDLSFYQEDAKDRDSARDANVAVITNPNSGWLNRNLMPILALSAVAVALYGLVWTPAETDVKYALVAIITQVLQYFFGSSSLTWKNRKGEQS